MKGDYDTKNNSAIMFLMWNPNFEQILFIFFFDLIILILSYCALI